MKGAEGRRTWLGALAERFFFDREGDGCRLGQAQPELRPGRSEFLRYDRAAPLHPEARRHRLEAGDCGRVGLLRRGPGGRRARRLLDGSGARAAVLADVAEAVVIDVGLDVGVV